MPADRNTRTDNFPAVVRIAWPNTDCEHCGGPIDVLPVSLHRATLGVMTRSHPNDRHDTYSFLLDVSDFLRSLDGMSDWSDRITAIADENFDPSVDGDK